MFRNYHGFPNVLNVFLVLLTLPGVIVLHSLIALLQLVGIDKLFILILEEGIKTTWESIKRIKIHPLT